MLTIGTECRPTVPDPIVRGPILPIEDHKTLAALSHTVRHMLAIGAENRKANGIVFLALHTVHHGKPLAASLGGICDTSAVPTENDSSVSYPFILLPLFVIDRNPKLAKESGRVSKVLAIRTYYKACHDRMGIQVS